MRPITIVLDRRATLARVGVGRYLGGDWGATVGLSHRFEAGITVGAAATMTRETGNESNESAIDMGFRLQFPFDLGPARKAVSFGRVDGFSMSRDAGQRLRSRTTLYEEIANASARAIR